MTNQPAKTARSQIAFIVALFLVFAYVSVQYSLKVLTPRPDGNTRSAILRWSQQIQDMEGGENIHEKYNYPNPPIMPQMLWPLSELATASPLAGALTWFYLKGCMALACLFWVFRIVETPERPFSIWAKGLAVTLSLRPILGDLSHGNINIFILFLVTACLFAFVRGRDMLAGILLALAIACKVTPALFIVYFAWNRSTRVLLGTAVGLVLFFLLVPAAVFAVQDGSILSGWDRNWSALTSWVNGMIVPYLVHGVVTPERENQSLPGLLTRLLTHQPSFSAFVDGIYTPLAFHNVADLGASTVKRIVQGSQVLFLLTMVVLCRSRLRPEGNPRRGWRPAAEYSFILVGMLLFSERTWKHHCVTLLLPFAVLCYGFTAVELSRGRRWLVGGSIAAAALLMLSTITGVLGDDNKRVADSHAGVTVLVGPTAYVGAIESGATARLGLVPDSPGKMAQVYGAYTWAFLVLIVGLCALMSRREAASQR